jgi:arylsulfatase A-like enzyme
MKRPNIILIMTDQQRADHVGCYGNPTVRTPHINSLAERGVRFDRLYVAAPSCMPNRASIMTGRMPSSHGVWTNGVPLSPRATTYVHHLREAGYRTALIGKSHLQAFTGISPVTHPEAKPGLEPPPPALRDAIIGFLADFRHNQELFPKWEEDDGFEIDLPFYGFDHVDLLVQHGDTTSGHYARWAKAKRPDYRTLAGPENEAAGHGYTAPWVWRSRLPVELHPTTFVEERTLDFLERHAAEGPEAAPFMVQCSFADPHHPFCPPDPFFDMYDPASVGLPPSFAPVNDPPPHVAALWRERDEGRRDRWTHLPMAVSEQEARQAIALTYGMVTMIDDAIGRILARLDSLGLSRDTIIVFMSDHGDLMGDHQLILKGPLHYQGLIRTPFIWADPEGPGGTATDELCSAIDVAPTLLERVGLQPNYGVQGKSLLGVVQGVGAGREAVLVEEDPQRVFMGFETPPRARTLVTRGARLTVFETADWGELYDLDNDPNEMHNRWDDLAHADLKTEMLHGLARRMTAHSNRAPLPTHRG